MGGRLNIGVCLRNRDGGRAARGAAALLLAACFAAVLAVWAAAWPADAEEADGVDVSTAAHMQTFGDSDGDGGLAGLPGEDKRLEALAVSVEAPEGVDLGVSYSVYSEGHGWLEGADGELAGTSGESLSISRVVVELTGEDADAYAVWYRVWVDGYGWTGWAYEGQECGTHSSGATVEAVEVVVLPAGESPSGDVSPRVVTTAATCGEDASADSDDSDEPEAGSDGDGAADAAAGSSSSTDSSSSGSSSSGGSSSSDSSVGSSSDSSSAGSSSDSSSESTASADYYELYINGLGTLKVAAGVSENDVKQDWIDFYYWDEYYCVCRGSDGLVYSHEFDEGTYVTTTSYDGLCTTTVTTELVRTCSRCGFSYAASSETEYEYSHDFSIENWLHIDNGYGCKSCDESFHTLEELDEHVQEVHGYVYAGSWWTTGWAYCVTQSSDLVYGEYEDRMILSFYTCSVCGALADNEDAEWIEVN